MVHLNTRCRIIIYYQKGPPIIPRTTQIPKTLETNTNRNCSLSHADMQVRLPIIFMQTIWCCFRSPCPAQNQQGTEQPETNYPKVVWDARQPAPKPAQKTEMGSLQSPKPAQKWSREPPDQKWSGRATVESTHAIRAPKLAQKWSGEPKAPKLVLDKSKPKTFGQHFWPKLSVKTQGPKP